MIDMRLYERNIITRDDIMDMAPHFRHTVDSVLGLMQVQHSKNGVEAKRAANQAAKREASQCASVVPSVLDSTASSQATAPSVLSGSTPVSFSSSSRTESRKRPAPPAPIPASPSKRTQQAGPRTPNNPIETADPKLMGPDTSQPERATRDLLTAFVDDSFAALGDDFQRISFQQAILFSDSC